jgi:hypothetical protein
MFRFGSGILRANQTQRRHHMSTIAVATLPPMTHTEHGRVAFGRLTGSVPSKTMWWRWIRDRRLPAPRRPVHRTSLFVSDELIASLQEMLGLPREEIVDALFAAIAQEAP